MAKLVRRHTSNVEIISSNLVGSIFFGCMDVPGIKRRQGASGAAQAPAALGSNRKVFEGLVSNALPMALRIYNSKARASPLSSLEAPCT